MAAIPTYNMTIFLLKKVAVKPAGKKRKPFYIEWHKYAYRARHYFASVFTPKHRSMRTNAPAWGAAPLHAGS